MNTLNEQQQAAVTAPRGITRVIAGAGTGKTTVLVHRAKYVLDSQWSHAENMVCFTFSKQAANNMRLKLSALGIERVGYVGTIHGFCHSLLRCELGHLKFPPKFLIIDDEDAKDVLIKIKEDLGVEQGEYPVEQLLRELRKFKEKNIDLYVTHLCMTPEKIEEELAKEQDIKVQIFLKFLQYQHGNLSLTFDDLIFIAVFLLSNYPCISGRYHEQLKYLMVDEFQDINTAEYKLIRLLVGNDCGLFVVGDPDQAIYNWRGSESDCLLYFDKDYPEVKDIILTQNYRSTANIIAVSNMLIKNNRLRIDKQLCATKPGGIPVFVRSFDTVFDEARFVASEISSCRNDPEIKFKDNAILVRSAENLKILEQELKMSCIPYKIMSGTSFFLRKEIKDVLAILRFIAYEDDISFERIINVPPRGFGLQTRQQLAEYAVEHHCSLYQALKATVEQLPPRAQGAPFIALIDHLQRLKESLPLNYFVQNAINTFRYRDYLHSRERHDGARLILEFESMCVDFKCKGEDALSDFLTKIALEADVDCGRKNRDFVPIMTIHAAKGLEFKRVFVIDFADGKFPNSKAQTITALEEERRVAYVGMTRAKDYLTLSYNLENSWHGPAVRSRFIGEIINSPSVRFIKPPSKATFFINPTFRAS